VRNAFDRLVERKVERVACRAGDVIHIPAGTPHQFFIAPGSQITYFLVKIAAH